MAASKKYGLIIKKSKPAQQVKKAAIFGNESSDEEESAQKAVNMSLMKEAEKKKQMKQTQHEIRKALEEDPTVYEYDNVYDEMAEKKKAANDKVPEKDKKPKYIEGLLKSAAFRKRDFERQVERQVQKEREKEGDEFHDKDAFVTEAYKKKMLEQAEEEERLEKQEALDAANDVTKQSDLSMFYRNLLNKNVSTGGEYSADNRKSESKAKEAEKKDENTNRNEKHREPRSDRWDRDVHRHQDRHHDRDNTRRSDKDYDKHGSRKRESVKDSNKSHHETVGGSGRHERSDEDRHPRRSSEHSHRHHQDTSGDKQDRNGEQRPVREKEDKQQEEDEDQHATEEDSEQLQAESKSNRVKTKKGHEEKADVPETQTKFAKRSTQETILSARDRYLARKRGRETAKAVHGSADAEED